MFLKNPRNFTVKQGNIMENFAETFTNNKTKNINKISDEIEKKLETVTTQKTNRLYMVALTWISKLADWWTPPKMHRLILLLIMMVLNMGRAMTMTSSRILLTILVQWKKQV